MINSRATTMLTIFFFVFFTFIGANPGLFSETSSDEATISKLLTDAENKYQSGEFKKAIEIYEQIIIKLNKRKELVETKQKLFRTMISLALTYFTIQETEKSKLQLEKLIRINPKQEIDNEIYPPQFIKIFNNVQKNHLGELNITSTPSGATVMLDNESIGTTPVNIKKFVKGEYVITVTKKGYSISTRKILVNQNTSNIFEVALEKSGGNKVVEKKGIKKNKKKTSPLLLIGGAVAIAAILMLVLKKKESEPVEQIRTMQFVNDVPTPIRSLVPSYSTMEVNGIMGGVRKVEFSIAIAHPRIEDLSIALVGTDNKTIYSVWNKGPHEDDGREFRDTTEIFNSNDPNGLWKITVTNSGERLPGEIIQWTLKIYYVQ
ncbi:MAG: PEGA domain-containing protein [Candidatus Aminicenantes bacterium]|nr:PEGA domain-containing protein [Candidatus Aminicenantes bacterium]